MLRSSNLSAVLKVLVVAAWSDDDLSNSELNYIKELARRFELTDEEWFQIQPYIEGPVPPEEQEAVARDLLARISNDSERKSIIKHLKDLTKADGRVSKDERELLTRYQTILEEASTPAILFGRLKSLIQKPIKHSTVDLNEFLRNKVLYKLRQRIGSEQITPAMYQLSLIGGLMAIVARADNDITDEEISKIRSFLSKVDVFTETAIELLLTIIREESARGLDRHRLIAEYMQDRDLSARIELLDLLFGVARADGEVKHAELEELRAISSALHLSHSQYIAAKLRIID